MGIDFEDINVDELSNTDKVGLAVKMVQELLRKEKEHLAADNVITKKLEIIERRQNGFIDVWIFLKGIFTKAGEEAKRIRIE